TEVHHLGVDLEALPMARRDWTSPPMRFVSVCRLIEKKGIEFALRALARMQQDRPERAWSYTIIGDGELRGALEALATELGIADIVRFCGAQPHDVVRRCLAESHVFVLPSVTARNGDVEGIPISLMEAMAAGLVPVSTFHSGIPELIEDG